MAPNGIFKAMRNGEPVWMLRCDGAELPMQFTLKSEATAILDDLVIYRATGIAPEREPRPTVQRCE